MVFNGLKGIGNARRVHPDLVRGINIDRKSELENHGSVLISRRILKSMLTFCF